MLIAFLFLGAQMSFAQQTDPINYVPGALIVKVHPQFRAQCSPQSIQVPEVADLAARHNAMGFHTLFPNAQIVDGQTNDLGQEFVDITLIYELRFPANADIPALAVEFSALPSIAYAEPRILHKSFFVPDDPSLNNQWYIDSVGAPEAWNLEKGDTTIVIGIIDTGTSLTHNDLKNQIAYNYADPIDGIDNDGDGYIDNYQGWDLAGTSYWAPADNDPSFVGAGPGMDHGVIVTGAACAEPNNSTGIAGLGYNTHFLPLKAGVDQSLSISFGYDALVYAADQGVDIANLSWGSGSYTQYGQDIVNYAAINHGVLVVAACGNRHQESLVYPASFANVLSIGATQVGDQVWDQQNGTGTTYNYFVDLMAPGASILSTAGPNGYWGGASGTSMSAPLVCAGAALAMAQNPQLNPIQAGELIRVGAEDIYAQNGAYLEDRIGTGQLDVFNALTLSNPKSVRIDSLMVRDDENDISEPFDTMQVYARVMNYLDPVTNLNVTLEAVDTSMVEIISGTTTIASLGTMSSTFNSTPFLIRIKKNVSVATRTFLRFSFSEGGYNDFQYFTLRIVPTSIDLDQNKIHTTVNGMGNLGFTDFPSNQIGLGYLYNGNNTVLLDVGFLAGLSQTKVVDNLRGVTGERTARLQPVERARKIFPGAAAAVEASAHYDDHEAGSHEIGLDIRQHTYQFNDATHDQYIILEYTLKNKNNYPLNDLYGGMSLQFIQTFFSISAANYYQDGEMIAALASNGGNHFWTGLALVTDHNPHSQIKTYQNYGYTDQEKFDALTQPAAPGSGQTGDLFAFLSGGPVNLGAGDSVTIAFVLSGGTGLVDLEESIERARNRYWCELKGEVPEVDLGADVVACHDDPHPILLPMGSPNVDYVWSTGDTTPLLTATAPGVYSVTVVNEYGCTASDDLNLEIRDLSDVQIGLPNNTPTQNAPLDFRGLSNRQNLQWTWSFGDGNASTQQNPSHTYSTPGSYTVSLTISDGICDYTTDTTIFIAPLVGLDDDTRMDIQIFPNPFGDHLEIRLVETALEPVSLRLIDTQGRVVWTNASETSSNTRFIIDGTALAPGFYLLESIQGETRNVQKLIHR